MAADAGIPVRIEVTEIMVGGQCPLGMKVGDTWVVADGFVPAGMCAAAWNAMQPYAVALRYGGAMPWNGQRTHACCCPDPENPVVFALTALEQE